MERMKILSNKKYNSLIIEIETLKEIRDNDEMCINMMADRINRLKQLEEENKKLNIKVASLEGEIKGLNSVIDKLKEENQTLELWLDRKEKLNKGYREDIDYWHHRCMVAERGGEDED